MNRIRWVLILWIILAISTLLQLAAVEYFGLYDYNWIDYIITPGASLATGVLLLFLFVLPVFDFSIKMKNIQRIILLSIAGLAYTIAFILIMHLFPVIFIKNSSDYKESILSFSVASFHNVIKNYLFQIAVLYAYEYISKEKELYSRQKDLEVELNRTRLQTLKSQLQPHFLFNSLNSVVAEIDENKNKAQTMLINLSDILRTSLNSDFTIPVTLEEEIGLIGKYLSIEKMRYEEQLGYEIKISQEAMKMKLPGMILQPLVENAIKHGFKGIYKRLDIVIEADADSKSVLVKNNGAPLSEFDSQVGLKNVSQRMEIFTRNQNSFKIFQEGNWVINKISLQ